MKHTTTTSRASVVDDGGRTKTNENHPHCVCEREGDAYGGG
jgi:hypothetical protein